MPKNMSTAVLCLILCTAFASCKTSQSNVKELRAVELAAAKDWQGKMGFFLGRAEIPGARIVQIADFGFADVIKLREGDVIVAVNGVKIGGPDDFQKRMKAIPKRHVSHWVFSVVRLGKNLEISNPAGFHCSPMDLIGCGPVPPYRKMLR